MNEIKILKSQAKSAVSNFADKYTISRILLIACNTMTIAFGIFLAILVNNISKVQRANIDNNLAQLIDNSEFMEPILIILVFISLMLVFGLAHSHIFTSKLMPSHIITSIQNQSIHNIIYPLLYEFLYLFSDDIMKSCSAEVILCAITIMLIFNCLQILYTVREIMLDNAMYVQANGKIKDAKKDKILNMLQCIYDRQQQEEK